MPPAPGAAAQLAYSIVPSKGPILRQTATSRRARPFGLVRYGVAPDHQKIKRTQVVFERILARPEVRLFANVRIGTDLSVEELLDQYDQVLIALGSSGARELGVPGSDLPGNVSATAFVNWYNGHPDYVEAAPSLHHERAVVVGMGNVAGRFRMVEQLDDLGLLGPDTTYIHCNHLTDREFQLIADTGGTTSIAPMVEMTMGHGMPPIQKFLDRGLKPSLSVDVETNVPGDMFTQMRSVMSLQHALSYERQLAGDAQVPKRITTRDVLAYATIEGARANGLADKTGSLTPGKEADVIMLRTDKPIMPGERMTYQITADGGDVLSLVAMLAITNDGFVGLDSVPLTPGATEAIAFDAGTEENTESAADVPGNYMGMGHVATTPAGPVMPHPGIQGTGDVEAKFDWSGSVARVEIIATTASSGR